MKKQRKLSTQISLIFLIIVVVSVILIVVLSLTSYNQIFNEQNQLQLEDYFVEVKDYYETHPIDQDNIAENESNGYIIIFDKVIQVSYNVKNILIDNETADTLVERFFDIDYDHSIVGQEKKEIAIKDRKTRLSYFGVQEKTGEVVSLTLVFTGDHYIQGQNSRMPIIITFTLGLMFILASTVIYIWSNTTVSRVSQLKASVDKMQDTNYGMRIPISGRDEITELSESIENMRIQIKRNEEDKQNVMQNISHDLKTPISVIKSYAEAIKDEVVGVEAIDVIIKQTDLLNQKVGQLLELNKLDYLKDKSNFEKVSIKEVVNDVVNNHMYLTDIEFITDLDDSQFTGIKSNYNIVISNIVDNALRYAQTHVAITLKDNVLSIYNDGIPIEQKFIDHLFKPYEKGSEGQFGLGMSIVEQMLKHFDMDLQAFNLPNGVKFVIKEKSKT